MNLQGWLVYFVGINFLMYCFHLCSEEVADNIYTGVVELFKKILKTLLFKSFY